MTHEELNPFAAPGSNTSPDSTTVSLGDLFKGSLNSIFDGPEGALRTGLRITLAALLLGLCFGLLQSVLFMTNSTRPIAGGTLVSVLSITGLLMSAGKFGEFVGACFLWKGSPRPRTLATGCCCILVTKALLDYLLPRFLSASEFSIAAFVISSIFGCAFAVARLLLLKTLSLNEDFRRLANIVIAITIFIALVSVASVVWQVGFENPISLDEPLGKLFHGFFLVVYFIVSWLEIRVVYRLLCEKLKPSVESFA